MCIWCNYPHVGRPTVSDGGSFSSFWLLVWRGKCRRRLWLWHLVPAVFSSSPSFYSKRRHAPLVASPGSGVWSAKTWNPAAVNFLETIATVSSDRRRLAACSRSLTSAKNTQRSAGSGFSRRNLNKLLRQDAKNCCQSEGMKNKTMEKKNSISCQTLTYFSLARVLICAHVLSDFEDCERISKRLKCFSTNQRHQRAGVRSQCVRTSPNEQSRSLHLVVGQRLQVLVE